MKNRSIKMFKKNAWPIFLADFFFLKPNNSVKRGDLISQLRAHKRDAPLCEPLYQFIPTSPRPLYLYVRVGLCRAFWNNPLKPSLAHRSVSKQSKKALYYTHSLMWNPPNKVFDFGSERRQS